MGIIHAFLHFLLGAIAPGSGRRRAATSPATGPLRSGRRRPDPAPHERPRPARGRNTRPRSPYGLGDTFAGEDTALVRPYLLEYERQEQRAARQRWRRLSLVMAADFGFDLDTRDVHATGVAW